jgi:hypothetical protein
MDVSTIQTIVLANLAVYGTAAFAIIIATVGVGVAYLIFRFGWSSIQISLDTGFSVRDVATSRARVFAARFKRMPK